MEAISLAVAFPGFINDGIELRHRFQAAKSFQTEAGQARILLKSNLTRLHIWEEKAGVKDEELTDDHDPSLDNPDVLSNVWGHLRMAKELGAKIEKALARLSPEAANPAATRSRLPFPSKSGMKWGFGHDKTILDNLQKFDKHVERLYQLVTPKLGESWEHPRISDDLNAIQSQITREYTRVQTKAINEWIQAGSADQQFETHRDARLAGTGNWIFSHPAYQSWLLGEPKLLWLCGPAGSGKTVLCATVIQHLRASSSQGPPVVYCFCSVYAQAVPQLQGIIRAFISQFARQSLRMREQIWEYMHSSTCDRGDVASQSDLWTILKALLENTSGCILIIDGLDEFDGSNLARSKFLRHIKSTVGNTSTKVMVTSRDEGDIRDELLDAHICKITKVIVRDDIRQLAESLISERLPRKTETLKHELSERLTDKSDGMFLWIKQQNLLLLRGTKTDSKLRQIVDKMPSGLTETYMRVWREITNQAEEDYIRTVGILRWAAFSFRPLTVVEIMEAIMVHPDVFGLSQEEWPDEVDEEYIQEEIKGLCGSLINVQVSPEDPSSSTVHLAHASVKEFLLEMLGATLQNHHAKLAEVCLRYMNFSQVWQPGSQRDESKIPYAFLNYAANMWHKHSEAAMQQDSSTIELINSLLDPERPTFSSMRNYLLNNDTEISADAKANRKEQPGNPLWFAIGWNMVEAAKHLLSTHPELLDALEPGCETPLILACARGYMNLANLLIDKNADVEFRIDDRGPALISAIAHGQMDLVASLVDRGLDMEIRDSLGRTAFFTACWWNHTNVAVYLLERGANPVVICNENTSPFFWACVHGSLDLVSKIFDESRDLVSLRTKKGTTPFCASVHQNQLETAEYLLKNGAEALLEAASLGKTPLLIAAQEGYLDMLHLLLAYGADPHALSNNGQSALHLASSRGSSEVAEVLLALGVDPNLPEAETSDTALHIAAYNGNVEVTKVLLDWSAQVQQNDPTPLHFACCNGHTSIASLLLDYGTDVNHAGSNGDTPLHCAASNGHVEVMQLLLDRGADLKALNSRYETPLDNAASQGHLETAGKLLALGADINAPDAEGCTPLANAAAAGKSAMVNLLLSKGANPMARQNVGWLPVHAAAYYGDPDIAEYLLQYGSAIDDTSNDSQESPLTAAAKRNHFNVVELFLKYGAQVNTRDYLGFTPLHYAAEHNNQKIARILLNCGAAIEAESAVGDTPLHIAVENGCLEIAEYLMARGASTAMRRRDEWTLLHIAAHRGHSKLIKFLLRHGANIHAQASGSLVTPLSLAVSCEHYAASRALCEHRDMSQFSIKTLPLNLQRNKGLQVLLSCLWNTELTRPLVIG